MSVIAKAKETAMSWENMTTSIALDRNSKKLSQKDVNAGDKHHRQQPYNPIHSSQPLNRRVNFSNHSALLQAPNA